MRVPFPFGVLDNMWHSIVSVPDRCLFILFAAQLVTLYKGSCCNVNKLTPSYIVTPTIDPVLTAEFKMVLQAKELEEASTIRMRV